MNIFSIKYLNDLLTVGKGAPFFRGLFFIIFIFPSLFLSIFSLNNIYRESTESILSDKRSLAFLAASIVDEKLDAITDLGISFATRPLLIKNVENGDWPAAINVLDGVLRQFTFIDRIVLLSPDGVIRDGRPELPDVLGQSRANQDWYRAIKASWSPVVSNVYERGSTPKINVVSVAVPVKGVDGHVYAILLLQLKIESFQSWFQAADVGRNGFIYIVDHNGKLILHPKFEPRTQNVDFSSVGIIQKVIAGIGGAAVNYNAVEKEYRVAAYEPVRAYGWGVVVTQRMQDAFEARDKGLLPLWITYGIIIVLTGFLAVFVLYSLITHKKSAEDLEKAHEELKALSLTDPLTGLYNRRGFDALSDQQWKVAKRAGQHAAIFFIDVDNMKPINDRGGHAAGDLTLVEVSGILKMTFRESDIIARIGGDEFLIFAIVSGKDMVQALLHRFDEQLQERNRKCAPRAPIAVSIGFTTGHDFETNTLEDMISQADKRMYIHKWEKKGR
ncbi:MAG: diguanylate cyclase [Candidatus Omnitrophica bacterium]|nr:diguanylate cyclase [Candidatus Omnitrophota bacterium]